MADPGATPKEDAVQMPPAISGAEGEPPEGGAQETTDDDNELTPDEQLLNRIASQYAWKVSLTSVAFAMVGLGVIMSFVFLLDFEFLIRFFEVDRMIEGAFEVVSEKSPGLEEQAVEELALKKAQTAAAALFNFVFFIVAMILSVFGSMRLSAHIRDKGEFSDYGLLCIRLTRQPTWSSLFHICTGALVLLVSWFFVQSLLGWRALLYLYPLMTGTGLGLIAYGAAIWNTLDILLPEPHGFPGDKIDVLRDADVKKDDDRARGGDLLHRLRGSPIFRRQVVCDFPLRGQAFARSADDVLARLQRRYPRISAVIPHTGIDNLSHDQTKALDAILSDEGRRDRAASDHVLVGFSGAGRSTLANLLSLSAVLHREGAMYCVTAESPSRSVDNPDRVKLTARSPVTQLRQWVRDAEMDSVVRLSEAYADVGDEDLRLELRPDMVFTDVRMLSRAVLSRVRGDAKDLVARLRYVVIDHPNRLSREDLVRLRIAIARLRMTAELFGREITFLLILPRLNNFQGIAKYLLNNENVAFHEFGTWPSSAHVVGWLPPLEIFDLEEDEKPLLVRASFTAEITRLLSELGYQSNQLHKPLRIAVIDAQPLLGPEAREHIREQVRIELSRDAPPDEEFTIRAGWHYFATNEIAIDKRHQFDVIVSLGVGSHPAHLVSSLRAALAPEGAMILVGDSSPEDIESLREISADGWDPSATILDINYPSLILPDHSEAVIAHELASLFEDFGDRPVPRRRLSDVFPGEHTSRLLADWEDSEKIEAVAVFETIKAGTRPEVLPYLRRRDATFAGSQYEVPWGCCSRTVYRVYDEAARRHAAAGPHVNEYIDSDRIFVDFYPFAVLRYPPNTVVVRDRRDRELTLDDREAAHRRFVNRGDIVVAQQGYDANVGIDRRRPRFDVDLQAERPFENESTWKIDDAVIVELDADPLSPVLCVEADPSVPRNDREASVQERRRRIVDGLYRPTMAHGTRTPRVRMVGGSWICRIAESMRDVVQTDEHLVEEPFLVHRIPLQRSQRFERTMETVALSVFFELDDDSLDPTKDEDLIEALGSRAAHNAVARAMRIYFERQYVNFDMEFRFAVVSNARAEYERRQLSAWRVLLYRLRADEIGAERTLGGVLSNPQELRRMLRWVHQRLESCDCLDGCPKCCSELGTIPERQLPHAGYEDGDAISRRYAYVLTCALLGRKPDWEAYVAGQRQAGEQAAVPQTRDALMRIVDQVVGTPDGEYRDGTWTELFKHWMNLSGAFIADVKWLDDWPDTVSDKALGLYSPKENVVYVKPGVTEQSLRETLVHEFTHCWQYRSDEFDLDEHRHSSEAKRYFDGKLVIEGHATWADHQLRFSAGLGPSYTPQQRGDWNEYKVGYFLMEGIEKAVGERGLFTWLREGMDVTDETNPIRSRNPRLSWPFTLKDALEAFDLHDEARDGRYTGLDIVDE